MTMILNQNDGSKKYILRVAKTLKNGEYINLTKEKNDEDNHSSCSYRKWNEFLKENGMIKVGKLEAVSGRFNLDLLLVRKKS